jgi:hypothetical protein
VGFAREKGGWEKEPLMVAEKVTLTREKETLLITLYARAEESRLPGSLLHDHFAAEAVRRIDYDFAKLKVPRDTMISVAMRAKILDDWTRDFIARNPSATVLHLGAAWTAGCSGSIRPRASAGSTSIIRRSSGALPPVPERELYDRLVCDGLIGCGRCRRIVR